MIMSIELFAPYNDFTAKNIYMGLNCRGNYKKRLIDIGRKSVAIVKHMKCS
jgi:hypothetical protein